MNKKKLSDAYSFPGFVPNQSIIPHPLNSHAYIIPFKRLQKKLYARYAQNGIKLITIKKSNWLETFHADVFKFIFR